MARGSLLIWQLVFALILLVKLQTLALPISNYSEEPDQEWVRVRLDHGLNNLEIQGQSLQVQGDSSIAETVSLPSQAEEQMNISHIFKNGQWLWRVEIRHSQFENADVRLIGEQYLIVSGKALSRGSQALPNHLIFAGRKTFSLIAVEHLRDYLYGVVAKEMPIQWPLEALKAQAIAARSYAKAMIKEHPARSYQLESSVKDQVYEKFGAENFQDPKMSKLILAVSETSGMVLLDKNHKVLKAYYHADCGGKTSGSEAVFGTKGLSGGVVDASCPLNPKARWSYRITREELSKRLKRFFHATEEFLGVTSLKAHLIPQDERIDEVVVQIEDGESRAIKAQEFRELLGNQDLRSTRFKIYENKKQVAGADVDEFVFSGTGFGHGVGLCQWGTRTLAQQGLPFRQILSHYYPGIELKTAKNFNREKSDDEQGKHRFN